MKFDSVSSSSVRWPILRLKLLEYVLKRIDIGRMVLDRFERFVETRSDIRFQMADLRPMGFLGTKKVYWSGFVS